MDFYVTFSEVQEIIQDLSSHNYIKAQKTVHQFLNSSSLFDFWKTVDSREAVTGPKDILYDHEK